MRARGTLTSDIGGFSKAYRRWLLRFAMVMISCGSMVNAQSPVPAETRSGTSNEGSSSPNTNTSPQKTQEHAPQAAAKPGSIIGTILDQSGAVSVGTVVRLTSEDKSFSRDVVSGDNGQFSFWNVPPGHFNLSINSTGFGNRGNQQPGRHQGARLRQDRPARGRRRRQRGVGGERRPAHPHAREDQCL